VAIVHAARSGRFDATSDTDHARLALKLRGQPGKLPTRQSWNLNATFTRPENNPPAKDVQSCRMLTKVEQVGRLEMRSLSRADGVNPQCLSPFAEGGESRVQQTPTGLLLLWL